MPDPSRSLRLRAFLVTAGALAALPFAPVAAAAAEAPAGHGSADAALGPEVRTVPPATVKNAPQPETDVARAPAVIAQIQGVDLLDVTTRTLTIGFHEGATRSLALEPNLAVPEGTPQPVVMGSRGRGTPPTSAIDIAVPEDAPVTAPVSGKVVEANEYGLYGSTNDFMITIAPAEAPHLRVRLFHLEGPKVAVDDAVVAGETVIAERSRVLPFSSQIDRLTGWRAPHVHLQVDNG